MSRKNSLSNSEIEPSYKKVLFAQISCKLSLTVTNSLDYTGLTNKENLIGMTWKNKQIPLIGDGNGDGGYCHWNFYRKQGSSLKEFIL